MVSGVGTDLAIRMAELARTLAVPQPLDAVLNEVTKAAVELITGIDTAGILVVGPGGEFESLAVTTELPHRLDELQIALDQGPCLQAAVGDDLVVRTEDFRAETRWPEYSRAVMKMGVFSGMSFKLYSSDRSAGALNLFGFRPTVWTEDQQTVGSVLAAHAAAALLTWRHSEEMSSALASRDRIGQAKGIIMERFAVDDTSAFNMLRRLSQESNVKLVDIAQQVIDTRGPG